MNLSFRNIKLTDSLSISLLSNELGYAATAAETETRLKKILPDKQHYAYLAADGEKVIGWIHAFYVINLESPSFIEIAGLVVDSCYRGKGIGKKLIEQVERWAHEKKCSTLRVRSNVLRKGAHEFYRRQGFIEIKEQKIFERQQNNKL